MEIKEFKTFEEQVAKLIEHGCEDIVSKEYAINILKRINYYRLTAYFLLLEMKSLKIKNRLMAQPYLIAINGIIILFHV